MPQYIILRSRDLKNVLHNHPISENFCAVKKESRKINYPATIILPSYPQDHSGDNKPADAQVPYLKC